MSSLAAPVPVARAAGADDRFSAAAMHIDRLDAVGGSPHVFGAGEKSPTPATMLDGGDWDGGYRKRGYGPPPTTLEVLRNDRTPLNTPYTPQLVKLHLTRHDEFAQQQQDEGERVYTPVARQFVSGVKSRLAVLAQPVLAIRCTVDKVLERVLPSVVQRSPLFVHNRRWLLWYLTTVISIPFALLLSPMVIAFCICTSPIWLAGLAVLLVRALVPAWHHAPLADPYVRKASPGAKRHAGSNGASVHALGGGGDPDAGDSGDGGGRGALGRRRSRGRSSHPNSLYRHANITGAAADHDG